MKLAFVLSMPNPPSWNGKWSGDGKLWAKVITIRAKQKAQTILDKKYYSYRWDDGWCAAVHGYLGEAIGMQARRSCAQKNRKGRKMNQNKFEELVSILGTAYTTVASVTKMIMLGKLDLTAKQAEEITSLGMDAGSAIADLQHELEKAGKEE